MIDSYFGNGDYGEIEIYPPTSVDSDGVPQFGAPVPVGARFQLRTLTVKDGNGNSVAIDATCWTDYTVPQDLGAKVVHNGQSYRIATRRLYHDLDGPSHQTFWLERMQS